MVKFILKDILKKRKLSQNRFAKMIGMEPKNICRLLRDGYDPKLSMLDRCANALKMRIRDLFKE